MSSSSELSYNGLVAVVTGAGGGLGAAYSKFFASRGAKVVVNDFSRENADRVVSEIKGKGGEAVANYDSVEDGERIVKLAMDNWGRVDILINNAGIIRDKSFKSMTDKEWDTIQAVHVRGAYKCAHACWPIFRKQKFGRIVNTASAAGLYGNFGQANYSAAKLSLTTFSKTLAKEGVKYNINVNCIAPIAASQMTATVMPPDILANLKPEMVVPLVAYLTHPTTKVSGSIFECGAGWYAQIRFERSKGVVFKTDDSYTPSAVKKLWGKINDFSVAHYPDTEGPLDQVALLKESKAVPTNEQSSPLVSHKGKTAVITGAGGGLGRAYALMFAKQGANVVVNDVSAKAAEKVVEEIKKAGGKAVVNTSSVEDGEAVIKSALDAFGSIHILINNAGILRDKSFTAMSDEEWDSVYRVHVKGTYACSHAAWPIFQQQKYGRIVNTCSVVGLYGNFGQANYSTAKAAIMGLTKSLAVEGKKYNILANTLAPNAGTQMTATIWPEEMVKAFSPTFIAPVVGYLTSEDNETTGMIYEASGGWVAATRWQRSPGHAFSPKKIVTPEQVASKWQQITSFDNATYPATISEAFQVILENSAATESDTEEIDTSDPQDSDLVKSAKKQQIPDPVEYAYTERDVMLYNLGVGATEKQLDYTFEGSTGFQALPVFGVIPPFQASGSMSLDWLPNFSPMMLLHGEQYLSIKQWPIPTSGRLSNAPQLLEVLDKGKAAAVTTITQSVDQDSGEVVFENQSTVFVRGAGGFGGRKTGKDRGAASAQNTPPSRQPDKITEEKTLERQAALYRLSGDYNPLHIDPEFSKVGGFKTPILHGLCFMGIAGKHVYEAFGAYKDIKVRFAGHVFPGETIRTEMWKEGDKVIFIAKCVERGTVVLSAAGATLLNA